MNNLSLSFNHSPFALSNAVGQCSRTAAEGRRCHAPAQPSSDEVSSSVTAVLSSQSALTSSLSSLSVAIGSLRDRLDSLTTASSGPAADTTSSVLPTSDGAGSLTSLSAKLISKQRGELTIQTVEGDVVTLKFSNKVSVDYRAQQAQTGDTTVSGESLDVRSRSRIAVQVQGDLNDQELAAVNDLVTQVGNLANDFYNGNVDQALANADHLSFDSTQLADYSLSLSLRQSVRVQGFSYTALPSVPADPAPSQTGTTPAATTAAPAVTSTSDAVTPVASDATAAAPVVTPASTSAVTPATQDTAAASATTPSAAAVADPAAGTAVGMATGTTGSGSGAAPIDSSVQSNQSAAAPVASATQIVASYLAKVRSSLQVSSTDAQLGFSYEFKVRLLVSSISQSAPVSPPSESALSALTQQLQAPAAT